VKRRQGWIVLGVALACGLAAQLSHMQLPSDLTQCLVAFRHWWAGGHPYDAVGPGRTLDSIFGLVYPLPAVMVAAPFAVTPWPDGLFAGLGVLLWGWAIKDRYPAAWWALPSWAGFFVIRYVQWEALLTGAALLRWPAFLLVCKPQLGVALFAAFPSRQALYGGLALVLASVLLLPDWPGAWLSALDTGFQFRAPVQEWGGPLILLALLEWRRAEARLLVAMACVPQTPSLYGLFPLFLIPRSQGQGCALFLCVTASLVLGARFYPETMGDNAKLFGVLGPLVTWCVYLPCTWLVMREPVVAWLRRRAPRVAAWLA
jgi:hypothetical protein